MQQVGAFFRLIRWPNLCFILLTQLLFYFCLMIPVFQKENAIVNIDLSSFLLLVVVSVFIAAAGYIINDYFDINIDQINKPGKVIISRWVTRRWAILWHSLLSLIGVGLSFYVGWRIGVWWIGPSNLLSVFLLFIYSTTFKKSFLTGNVIIALLTAWTIALPGLASFYALHYNVETLYETKSRLLRFTILYGGFAFIISLVREAVKDMEDLSGDAQFGCSTLPIKAGINAAKTYVLVWMAVLIGAIIIVQVYASQLGWWLLVFYSVSAIIVPLAYAFKKCVRANTTSQYAFVSRLTKLVMLTGILSLLFFKMYL